MAEFPYNLDIISCGKDQLDRLRTAGYRIDEHRLELFGLCPDCRSASVPA